MGCLKMLFFLLFSSAWFWGLLVRSLGAVFSLVRAKRRKERERGVRMRPEQRPLLHVGCVELENAASF